jgi:hypothetical protein
MADYDFLKNLSPEDQALFNEEQYKKALVADDAIESSLIDPVELAVGGLGAFARKLPSSIAKFLPAKAAETVAETTGPMTFRKATSELDPKWTGVKKSFNELIKEMGITRPKDIERLRTDPEFFKKVAGKRQEKVDKIFSQKGFEEAGPTTKQMGGILGGGIAGAGIASSLGSPDENKEEEQYQEYKEDREKTLSMLPSKDEIEGLRDIPKFGEEQETIAQKNNEDRYKRIYDYSYKWRLSNLGSQNPNAEREAQQYALSKAEEAKKADDLIKLEEQRKALVGTKPQQNTFSPKELVEINARRQQLGLQPLSSDQSAIQNTAADKLGLKPLETQTKFLVGQTPPASSGLTAPQEPEFMSLAKPRPALFEPEKEENPEISAPSIKEGFEPGLERGMKELGSLEKKYSEQSARRENPKELEDYYRKRIEKNLAELGMSDDPLVTVDHGVRTARQESGFNQSAMGKDGDAGVMQVTPIGFQEVKERYDVPWTFEDVKNDEDINIKTGLLLMRINKDFYGAKTPYELAAMYNGGPNGLKKKQALDYASRMYPQQAEAPSAEAGTGQAPVSKTTPSISQTEEPKPYLFGGELTEADMEALDGETGTEPSKAEELQKLPQEALETSLWRGVPFARPDLEKLAPKTEQPTAEVLGVATPKLETGATPTAKAETLESKAFSPEVVSALKKEEPTINNMLLMMQALKNKGDMKGANDIARALNQITQGIIGVKSKTKIENEADKLFAERAKEIDGGMGDVSTMMKMKEFQENNDPRSQRAESFRDLLQEKFNISKDSLKNLSVEQMEKVFAPLASMTKAERDYAREQKKSERDTIMRFREKIRSGEPGKIYGTLQRARRTNELLSSLLTDPRGIRSGSRDLVTFMNAAKTIQGDESVVREAEQKFLLELGSLPDRVKASLAKFFRGEIFAPNTRKELLDAIRQNEKAIKRNYEQVIEPDLAHARELGINPKYITDIYNESYLHPDSEKRVSIAKQFYNSEKFKTRYPDKEMRKKMSFAAAEKVMSKESGQK